MSSRIEGHAVPTAYPAGPLPCEMVFRRRATDLSLAKGVPGLTLSCPYFDNAISQPPPVVTL
ncbi:hypothetical protein MesoLj113c_54710 [Mesorhizobium sp. 113-3-9]|nr:hypothetical protein MesoLj113c_54710 [Mesorhizobium sp. 113-3-9]